MPAKNGRNFQPVGSAVFSRTSHASKLLTGHGHLLLSLSQQWCRIGLVDISFEGDETQLPLTYSHELDGIT